MENRINVAELLKDCPTGMELDSTMFEKVTFVRVQMDRQFPIEIAINGIRSKYLTKEGCFHDRYFLPEAKCVIFPKGKNTWEEFTPPYEFKNGDVIVKNNFIAIISHIEPNGRIWYHCWYNTKYEDYKIKTDFGIGCINDGDEIHFATKEEKEKLFKVIEDNGYKWNEKTNTLEKLIKPIFKKGDKVRVKNGVSEPRIIDEVCDRFYTLIPIGSIHFIDQHNWELVPNKTEPKFKVGDKVKSIYNNNQYIIIYISDTHYTLEEVKEKFKYIEPIIEDKNWELVPDKLVEPKFKVGDKITNGKASITIGYIDNEYYYEIGRNVANRLFIKNQDEWNLVPDKFDISTLKPFDKVLIRDNNSARWDITFYELYDNENKSYPYRTLGGMIYKYCIPYEGNEHLCGKRDDCIDFYKTWE